MIIERWWISQNVLGYGERGFTVCAVATGYLCTLLKVHMYVRSLCDSIVLYICMHACTCVSYIYVFCLRLYLCTCITLCVCMVGIISVCIYYRELYLYVYIIRNYTCIYVLYGIIHICIYYTEIYLYVCIIWNHTCMYILYGIIRTCMYVLYGIIPVRTCLCAVCCVHDWNYAYIAELYGMFCQKSVSYFGCFKCLARK